MKKLLLFVIACTLGLFGAVNAQETSFYYDFNDASVDDWTKIDADGDGQNWGISSNGIYAGYEGSAGLYSSCFQNNPLYPDNYFVTKNAYAITETSVLSFLHRESDGSYNQENFGVVVSENGTDWEVAWSKRYASDETHADGVWAEENVSLAAYAGKNLYLGFRHYECNGKSANGIKIDNVKLYVSEGGEGGGEEPEPTPVAPAAPTNVVATANGQNSITLTWTAVEGATNYNVYSAAGYAMGVTETEYTYEGLTAGTYYCFEVVAENAVGESADATEACATTEAAPVEPAKPVVTATATQTTVTLTWDAVDGATYYNIYTPNNYAGSNVYGLEATTYTFEGLTAGTEYCFGVSAATTIGYESDETEICATTEAAPVDPTPEPEEPVTITIGEGTYASINAPINNQASYAYSYSQQIYLKDEIGKANGLITSIAFHNNLGGSNTRNIVVYANNTEKSSYATDGELTNLVTVSASDIVYEGEFTFGTNETWSTIELQTPFVYTGENLVITVNDKTGIAKGYDGYDKFYATATTDQRCLYFGSYTVIEENMSNKSYLNNFTVGGWGSSTPGIPDVQLTIAPLAAGVMVSTETIALGEVQLGEYWSEKEDVTASVSVTPIMTTVTSITCDNDFFVLPTIDLTANPIEFEVAYNKNAAAGEQTGNLTITYGDGATKVVPMTATAYAPATADVFELAQEITFTENAYTDTPVFANLKDDYNLPAEEGANAPDAVYAFELAKESVVTVEVTGTNANYAIYKAEDLAGNGPKADNNYVGETVASDAPVSFFYNFSEENVIENFTLLDKDGDGYNWAVASYGIDGLSLKSDSYVNYTTLYPDNYIVTKEKYEITANSVLSFKYLTQDLDKFGVEVSTDGENFTNVWNIEVETNGSIVEQVVPLSDYAGQSVYIALRHYESNGSVGFYVYIDDLKLESGLPNAFPAGKYYLVAAAEDAFTVNVAIEALAPAPVAPAAPEVAVGTVTETTVELTWAAVDGATSYNVYVGESTEAVNVTEPTYTATGLTAETEYTFVVKAVNAAGESEASNEAKATTLAPAPVAPAAPEVAVGTVTETTVELTWAAVDGADLYQIYRVNEGVEVEHDTTSLTTYTVEGLTAETEYTFVVKAINEVGYSEASNVVTATTLAAPVAPATPKNVVATANGFNSITVTWEAVDGAAKYVVYKDGEEFMSTSEYTPTTTVTIDGLEMGKQYCFAVKAVANGLESELSEPVCQSTESLPENQVLVGQATDKFYSPFLTSLGNARFEAIYKAGEIAKAGRIAEIAFSYKDGAQTSIDVNIYLAEVEKSEFANPNDFTAESDLKLVYSGTGVTICDSEWETFVLNTPFDYSGENNLLLVVSTTASNSNAINNWNCYNDPNAVLIDNGVGLYYTKKPVMMLTLAPAPVAPAAPVVAVGTVTETTVELTWAAVDGATSYNVYVGESTEAVSVTETTYTATGLTAETEYTFVVKAVNEAGESEASNVAKATTLAPAPTPVVPAAPVVAAEATGETTIVLTWAAVDGATSYNVYVGESTEAVSVTETTYTATGLTAETEYTFVVKAVNEAGESEASNVAKATTLAPAPTPVVPAAPVVAVGTVTETTVELTWAAVDGATSYNIYSADTLVANVTETTYTVKGLTADTEYTFVVKAVNADGESEASNEAKAKTNAAAPVGPTAPATPVVTVEVSYDTIQISWQAVEGATSYRLYYNGEKKDEFTDTIVQIQVPSAGKYCFTITAVNEIGESEHAEACAEVVVPEGMVIPAAPVLNATLEEDKVVLSWEEVEGAVYYNVYVEVKPGENQLLGVAQMEDLPIRMQLPEKGEYCFFVTAANLAGESELSERACVNYGEGIEENAAAFNIYPNPVSDKLVIETEATIEAVTIYTVTGVMVYSEVDFNNNTIDVTDFANGVYIMKVRTENGEAVQRFIKK